MRNDYNITSYQRESTPRRFLLVIGILLALVVVLIVTLWWIKESRPVQQKPPSAELQAPAHDYKGQYYYAGMPKAISYPHSLLVLTNIGYVVAYDDARKDPAWVCYRLFKVTYLKPPPRPKGFSVDMRTTARLSSHDYTGSGYDRGHNAPNRAIGLCYGEQAQLQTFLMSNILPESKPLNEEVWEHLETTEITDYAQRFGTVWIITGPIFGAKDKTLKCGTEIPEACYKIMIRETSGHPDVLAFEIPQTVKGTESPALFLTSVRTVEADAGLDFLSELPADVQNRIETEKPASMW